MNNSKRKSCSFIIRSFCERKLTFQIIHGAKEVTDTVGLLVLDSSFNPPHLGHYNLVKRAINHYRNQSLHVLLLLSVNNADKAPKPATFDKRMEMMRLMADMLQEENISASVGITIYAKFVDKDKVLRRNYFSTGLISYLVGFDTIVRILDPNYYIPRSLSDALCEFMNSTNFFCLTRESKQELGQQIQYCSDINNGLYEPTIPRAWGHKIQIELNDEEYASVSSSHLRQSILNGCTAESLRGQVPSPILEYIMNQGKKMFV